MARTAPRTGTEKPQNSRTRIHQNNAPIAYQASALVRLYFILPSKATANDDVDHQERCPELMTSAAQLPSVACRAPLEVCMRRAVVIRLQVKLGAAPVAALGVVPVVTRVERRRNERRGPV